MGAGVGNSERQWIERESRFWGKMDTRYGITVLCTGAADGVGCMFLNGRQSACLANNE